MNGETNAIYFRSTVLNNSSFPNFNPWNTFEFRGIYKNEYVTTDFEISDDHQSLVIIRSDLLNGHDTYVFQKDRRIYGDVYGGYGNDTFIIYPNNNGKVHGGPGHDTIVVNQPLSELTHMTTPNNGAGDLEAGIGLIRYDGIEEIKILNKQGSYDSFTPIELKRGYNAVREIL